MVIWSCLTASALVLQDWSWNSILPEQMFSPILYSMCEWGEVASQNLYSVVEQVSNLYPVESDHPNIQETAEGTQPLWSLKPQP